MDKLEVLQNLYEELPLQEALLHTANMFAGRVKFSSALGEEDQLLTDIIARHQIPIAVFTLDTGRLFYETYDLLDITIEKYKIPITVYFPDAGAVQKMVSENGINGFHESVANRQACCFVRKVAPLKNALENTDVWITGLRASQTEHRKSIPFVEWLQDKKMYKINPLLHYSYEDVINYIKENKVPYNKLHDKGFVSIGCAPCTRAIIAGEDARAGRWWWEDSHKECGLHIS